MLADPEIQARLDEVRGRIAASLRRSGRPPDSCRLVLATKTQPAAAILAAYAAGARDFGENYVREAASPAPSGICSAICKPTKPAPPCKPSTLSRLSTILAWPQPSRDFSPRRGSKR